MGDREHDPWAASGLSPERLEAIEETLGVKLDAKAQARLRWLIWDLSRKTRVSVNGADAAMLDLGIDRASDAQRKRLAATRDTARKLAKLLDHTHDPASYVVALSFEPEMTDATAKTARLSAAAAEIAARADALLPAYKREARRPTATYLAEFVRGVAGVCKETTGRGGLTRGTDTSSELAVGEPGGVLLRLLKLLYGWVGPPHSTKSDEGIAKDIRRYLPADISRARER